MKLKLIPILIAQLILISCSSNPNESAVLIPQENNIAEAHISAIAEYLSAVYINDPAPDTLFIGKHPEFPEITLPSQINGTHLNMVPFGIENEFGKRKNYVYVNIASWFSPEKAEFIFVTFRQGNRPQHNCKIELKYNSTEKLFDLVSLNMEYPYPEAGK